MHLRHRSRFSLFFALSLFLLSGCKVLGLRTMPMSELKEKYESSTSRYIEVDGTNIHYRVEGNPDGPTLVMLHGVLASLHTWDGWVEKLKPYYRIVRLDLPGFGLTGPLANKNYTPEYADEIFEKTRAKLEQLYPGKMEKFTLIGNSLGGFISWYYAANHPERVDKLILIDPIGYNQDAPFIIRFASRPFFGWYASWQSPRFIIKRNIRRVYGDADRVTDETIDRYFELLLREGNRESMVDYFRTLMKYSKDPHIADGIRNIKAPTLLMWGEKDRWVPPALIEKWQADVPNIEVAVIDSAGHIPMEELPDETVRIAYAFLNDGKPLPDDDDAPIDTTAQRPKLGSMDDDAPDQEAGEAAGTSGGSDDSWESPEPEPEPEPAPAPAPKGSSRPAMVDWN